MRPLELRIRGFRSYHGENHRFDFRGRRLVGIVGPIGSGKSTILDAVAFALYGRTARVARGTKSLINQRSDHAAVALRFAVDDAVWEVQRSLRRKGQSQHALYRLARDADDAEHVEQVLQEAPVNERIEELLGLDFAAFSRSVLLAQNQFDQFLAAAPRDRDRVLKGVFGHDRIDRMRELARERAREAEIEAEKAAVRLQSLDEARSALEERVAAVAVSRERIDLLREHEPEMADLDGRLSAMTAELEQLEEREQELSRLEARLPDDDDLVSLVGLVRGTLEQRAARTGELEAAHEQLASLEATHSGEKLEAQRATIEAAGSSVAKRETLLETLALATSQVTEQADRLANAAKSVEEAEGDVEENRRALGEAEAELARAAAGLAVAEAALHDARHADMAATLQDGLILGEPCPVCRQRVAVLPETGERPEVEAAAAALGTAAETRERAEAGRLAASGGVEAANAKAAAARSVIETITADLEAARKRETAADAALVELDRELAALLGPGDPDELIGARRRQLREAEEALETARRSVAAARRDHDEAIEAEQTATKQRRDLQLEIAAVASLLGLETAPGDDDIDAVVRQVDQVRSGCRQQREQAGKLRADLVESVAAAQGRRDEISGLLHLEGSLDEAVAAARATLVVHEEEIERLRARIAGVEELQAERDHSITERDLHARLASDLTDSRFIRFLLDEERERLADLGSEHFQRLSDGRYRFTEDGTFEIVDLTTAEAVRKADSLSGGETFLASLGLALGLAEMVARSGGRLEAFFLDEGFGSLDPEHLDLAMEGIESLAAEHPDRLVVTVSHVAEMRHRIEDLIALERDPATGDTRVVRA